MTQCLELNYMSYSVNLVSLMEVGRVFRVSVGQETKAISNHPLKSYKLIYSDSILLSFHITVYSIAAEQHEKIGKL